MKFTLSLLLTALASSAVAIPQGGPGPVIFPAVAQLYTGPHFSGDATTLTAPIGDCVEFPYGFHNDVSSVKFSNATECELYTDDSCQSTAFRVTGPTPTLPASVNNKLNSVTCIDIFH